MILIADSGSTKTSWIAINKHKVQLFKVNSKGLNPAVFSSKILKSNIAEVPELDAIKDKVSSIYFYGAGCGTKTASKKINIVFSSFFKNAIIQIKEDTLAAIYATTNKPSIVCILGTGSNCTFFDGKKAIQKIVSLGYSIMDDASGNYFGKVLLRSYFYNKMPSELALKFKAEYNLNSDEIKKNLYQNDSPNTYLAGFSKFLIKNKEHAFFQEIIKTGLSLFIENQILQFKESKKLPIHFVGSIAYFLSDEISLIIKKYDLTLGKIERHPIDGLVNYHLNTL